MTLSISITFPQPNHTRRQLIRWDNPIAIQDGYSAQFRGNIGQFTMCPVYVTDQAGKWEGTWAENQMATPLTNDQMLQIAALQTADEFTVSQKMNWLMWGGTNTWGGPMKATYAKGSLWREATNIKMITAVYADEWVEVIGHQNLFVDFADKKEVVGLSEIKTYQPNEWTLPNATQKVTAVTDENVYQERPKGLVRLPIYFGNRRAWVFDRWLV
jgi:hypothetical protein